MTTRDRGFFAKFKSSFPITRARALHTTHVNLIEAARAQTAQSIMHGTLHAMTEKASSEGRGSFWWKAQTAKWETIWRMFNEVTTNFDPQKLDDLRQVSDAAFALYEQLAIRATVDLQEVTSDVLRSESLLWRDVAVCLSNLHWQCSIHHVGSPMSRKTSGNSEIIDMED